MSCLKLLWISSSVSGFFAYILMNILNTTRDAVIYLESFVWCSVVCASMIFGLYSSASSKFFSVTPKLTIMTGLVFSH
jgi:hypothetical protein